MIPIFMGSVNSGRLLLDKGGKFNEYLHTLNGKRIELTVEKLKHPRSNQQNRYYHGVVVKLIAEHTGHDPEQIHEALKQMFSPKCHLFYSINLDAEIAVPTSTTRLDTIAFAEYTEKCRMWANEFLGLNVPLPGEVS